MEPVRIKICCIASVTEARLALDAGADALGLVSAMPSGPGVIDETTIAAVADAARPPIETFLLTSLTHADAIAAQHARCGTTTIQLVDRVPPQTRAALRERLPGVTLVQVIHVLDDASIGEAVSASEHADAVLLDSGNPDLAVKQLGGTGRAHDWSLSQRIVEAVAPTRVYLAGGLKPENVAEAVARVRPFGVDVCSGVRTAGRLNADLLHALIAAVRPPN